MKRVSFSFFVFLLLYINNATAQKNNYKFYKGSIGNNEIEMHLYTEGKALSGFYYYAKTQDPIPFSGLLYPKDKTKTLRLTATLSDNSTEFFVLTLRQDSLTGKWNRDKKTLVVQVLEDTAVTRLYQYVCVNGYKNIKPQSNGITTISYQTSTIWPAKNNNDALQILIGNELGFKNNVDNINNELLKQKNTILSQKLTEEYITYGLSNTIQIAYSNSKLMVLRYENYVNTGGIHGETGNTYLVFDNINKRKITLSELIDTADNAWSKILENQYRVVNKIAKAALLSETLLVDTIPISNNFYITTKHIVFCYLPYEIGAYAMGNILIKIPIETIKDKLKPAASFFYSLN